LLVAGAVGWAGKMKLNRQQIQDRAMQVLEANPQGIRWMELVRALEAVTPDTPPNSVHGAIQNLLSTRTSEIVKVARGTYQLVKFVDADNAIASAQEIATETAQVKAETPGSETLTEQDFTRASRSGWSKTTRSRSRLRSAAAVSAASGARPT
jgi:hypothetical protein